jgi:hypothetical protein
MRAKLRVRQLNAQTINAGSYEMIANPIIMSGRRRRSSELRAR